MKRIFAKLREKISLKESPQPYRGTEHNVGQEEQLSYNQNSPTCEVLDLLAHCRISPPPNDYEESSAEYAEIRDMGLWPSTPLTHKHKSKISLTWVLKENLERTKLPEKVPKEEWKKWPVRTEVDRLQRHNQKFNDNELQPRKCKNTDVKERVVGRNEYYHNLRFRSACEEFVNGPETFSDTSLGTEEYVRRKHRHRHRRKKIKQNSKFGYDIKDLDSFLTEATIDRPGNIPVVIAYPSTLYQTQKGQQIEQTLPLGTVVNAVFKNEQWLYVQTPHGQEGYVLYGACLPLGILPDRPSSQKKTPCWESSTDIYPRPCGNITDREKEQISGRTRSECRYQPKQSRKKPRCAEKDFDTLYLKTKSVSNIDKIDCNLALKSKVKRQTLLVVSRDFKGNILNRTLSVQKGDVVTLVQGGVESDVDAEWFYVRRKDGKEGFIPAAIAGHGYI